MAILKHQLLLSRFVGTPEKVLSRAFWRLIRAGRNDVLFEALVPGEVKAVLCVTCATSKAR